MSPARRAPAPPRPLDPPPRRSPRFHAVAALVFVVVAGALYAAFAVTTRLEPARGYTSLGTALGIGASGCFLFALLYALRKRAGQEWRWLPGRLQTWLRLHLWVSLLGTVAVLLHAGFHVDGGVGTWALLVLGLVVVTGLGGWWIYVRVPPGVPSRVENLAARGVEAQRREAAERFEDLAAGRSDALRAEVGRLLHPAAPRVVGALAPGEDVVLEEAKRLHARVVELDARLLAQRRLHAWLRGWTWVHVPAAVLLVPAVLWHVYDAQEWRYAVRAARPTDYASPESCRECHPVQYEEWAGSSHATAMSSPVMELQTRLVTMKDLADFPRGGPRVPLVDDLCVRCHAPTGYPPGNRPAREELLALARERAPASGFGVSCVACHQVSSVHPATPAEFDAARRADLRQAEAARRRPDGRYELEVGGARRALTEDEVLADPSLIGFGVAFRNLDNVSWTHGRRMLGPFGPGAGTSDAHPSVGNREHRGELLATMREPEFCASCHTVVVDDPNDQGKRLVALQNTYNEWRGLGDPAKGTRWGADPSPHRAGATHCLQCHGMPLDDVVALVEHLDEARTDFDTMRAAVRAAIEANALPAGDTLAASPRDGFDQPLREGRRRFTHHFAGVDRHLGPDAPYPVGHARRAENAAHVEDAFARTRALLRIAAAVRATGLDRDGTLHVEVANLATGHNLPAGFAFARELWVEVAVSDAATRPAPDAASWRVVVGGAGGGLPLERGPRGHGTALDKRDGRLRNFQAVLFSADLLSDDLDPRGVGRRGTETVLQNETTAVLKGKAAQQAGFSDRVGPVAPGGVEALSIPLGVSGDGWTRTTVRWVRVRLRFRSLPPEFLERLARRFERPTSREGRGFHAPDAEPTNAARTRALIDDLRVADVADDVLEVR